MIRLKAGVRILGLKEIAIAIPIAYSVYQDRGLKDMRITSATEGKHSVGSLHYAGQAIDLGIEVDTVDWPAIKAELSSALGGDFDVVLEADHLHVEFQPKEPYR